MRRRRLGVLSSVALMLALGACGGDSSSPTAAPTPVPTPTPLPYIGNWTGTTSQSRSISFTVIASGLSQIKIQYQVGGSSCNVTTTQTVSFTTPSPITGNTFTATASGGSTRATIVGTFESASKASGTLTGSVTSGFCSGASGSFSWSATKS